MTLSVTKFHEFASTMEGQSISVNQNITRFAKDVQLDKALYFQLVQKRSEGVPVSEPILRDKAKQFNEQLHAGEATTPPLTAGTG